MAKAARRTTRVLTWNGARPVVGDYVRLAGGGIYRRIETIDVLSDGRIAVRLLDCPGELPRQAVRHGHIRVQLIDPAGPPAIRQVAGSGMNAVMLSSWRDPEDVRPNASRRPREIKGWRVSCVLRRAQTSGADAVTDMHVLAADYFRARLDQAVYGFSAPPEYFQDGHGSGQRSGPANAAIVAAYASHEVGRFLRTLKPGDVDRLFATVVFNVSVSRWCAMHDPALNRVREMTRLIGILDHLSAYFDVEIQITRAFAAAG